MARMLPNLGGMEALLEEAANFIKCSLVIPQLEEQMGITGMLFRLKMRICIR